jgi:hypothetical protein
MLERGRERDIEREIESERERGGYAQRRTKLEKDFLI